MGEPARSFDLPCTKKFKFKIYDSIFLLLAGYSICFWVFSMYPPKKDDEEKEKGIVAFL